jgi:hypothetical protein
LSFLEPPPAAAAVEELFLPIAVGREQRSLREMRLGCAEMAAGALRKKTSAVEWGKKLCAFSFYPSAVKITWLSQPFIPKAERQCKSNPTHVRCCGRRSPTIRKN